MLWLGSLIGGLLAARSARQAARVEHARQDTSISRIVADARTAGVHPLAALGSSAAGTFSTPILPTATTGDAIADAFGQFGADRQQAFANRQADRQMSMAEEAHDAQLGLLQAQRGALEMETAMMAARARSEIAAARAAVIGGPTTGGALAPYNPSPLGPGWVVGYPGLAQETEDSYGEIPGNLVGLGALVGDGARNLGSAIRPRPQFDFDGVAAAIRSLRPSSPAERGPMDEFQEVFQ